MIILIALMALGIDAIISILITKIAGCTIIIPASAIALIIAYGITVLKK